MAMGAQFIAWACFRLIKVRLGEIWHPEALVLEPRAPSAATYALDKVGVEPFRPLPVSSC